jgi:hypothetical protein
MFPSFDTLEPNDLALLRAVLEDVCREKGLAFEGPQARILARELTEWYLFGIRHPQQLKEMLEPIC